MLARTLCILTIASAALTGISAPGLADGERARPNATSPDDLQTELTGPDPPPGSPCRPYCAPAAA